MSEIELNLRKKIFTENNVFAVNICFLVILFITRVGTIFVDYEIKNINYEPLVLPIELSFLSWSLWKAWYRREQIFSAIKKISASIRKRQ